MNGWIMKKAKRIIGIVVAAALIVLIGVFVVNSLPRSYSGALKTCGRVLSRNEEEMTLLARNVLDSELTASNYSSGKYKDYSYTMPDDRKYVRFDIGAQGMLGGQYWSLVYCPDGEFCEESEAYFYREIGGGNNITKAERIDGHWWFFMG